MTDDPARDAGHTPASDPQLDPRSTEEAVAAYIDRLLAGERIDPLDVLLQHPGTGHEVLASIESFVLAGRDDPPLLRRFGDFTLLRELGRGGMGVVFEARQESMGRRVALKVLPAGAAAERKAFLRFLREAQTAGKLQHPAIVHVYSMGVEAETPFYAMEYIEGATLAEVIAARRERRPSPGRGVFTGAGEDLPYAVCVLGFLFLGGPVQLPCGEGSATAAGNIALLDWQPDGKVDLSDAVGLLQFLFSGGPPHPLGNACVEITDCPQTCGQ